MPVEIKELVIRAVADDTEASMAGPPADGLTMPTASVDSRDNDAIVNECVSQVMRLLARNKER